MSLAYLNGEYLPLEKAQVPAMDRGFLFGDGVYEVIPFYDGQGFGLTEHLDRLTRSLNAIEISIPLSHTEWQQVFDRLLANSSGLQKIYLQVTRGASLARDFTYPNASVKPTVFAFIASATSGSCQNGIKTFTLEDIRWRDCYIKSINLLASAMASEIAKRHGCQEAILYRDGKLTEGASSNVFVVKDGVVLTTPATAQILNGITRQIVLQILVDLAIPHAEVYIPLDSLQDADEIWITSSTREIAPVIELNGNVVGNGKPGPVWQQTYNRYIALATQGA